MVSKKIVLIERKENIATVIMNNHEKRNMLSREMRAGLNEAFEELQNDDSIDVVITTGAGTAWSAGVSGEVLMAGLEAGRRGERPGSGQFRRNVIREFPKVTIAAVNGYCLGGAISLLNSHDLAIASEEKAVFGLPEVFRGYPPGGDLAKSCSMASSPKWALDMALTGDNIDARTAQMAGLVSRVVPHDKLLETAFLWAKEISRWDKITLEYTKKMYYAAMEEPNFYKAVDLVSLIYQEHNRVNPIAYQGMSDFLAKKGIKATAMAKWMKP